jgi:hypothetical protein
MPPVLGDILHRVFVYSAVGVSVWGISTGYMVHRDTLKRGEGVFSAVFSMM